MGLGKYLKKAFLNHWNLLAFLGGMGFAVLSGHPDVFVPLVLAGEAAYVGRAGNASQVPAARGRAGAQGRQAPGFGPASEAFDRIIQALPRRQLRPLPDPPQRCVSLRQIAQQMRASEELSGGASPEPLDDMQLSGLDRLLWIYLRLLYTQTMLERFFESTSEDQIRGEIQQLEAGSPACPPRRPGIASRQNILKALEDNLETCRGRLANLQKAKENCELVEAEIERLENKIHSITEMAINRQDPQFVTGQVDQVAGAWCRPSRP